MITVGIDFGAKSAGTTVICAESSGKIEFSRAPRGMDADEYVLAWIAEHGPELVGIDAPLSLPGRYRGIEGCTDSFYRACDREAGGMSPMFLGGMTARAMRLGELLEGRGVSVIEVYPARLVKHFEELASGYAPRDAPSGDTLAAYAARVARFFGLGRISEARSWHDIDALLSYCSAERFLKNEAVRIGDPTEGVIWI